MAVGTKSIGEYGEEVGVGIAVLTEDVVTQELYAKNTVK